MNEPDLNDKKIKTGKLPNIYIFIWLGGFVHFLVALYTRVKILDQDLDYTTGGIAAIGLMVSLICVNVAPINLGQRLLFFLLTLGLFMSGFFLVVMLLMKDLVGAPG